MNDPIDISVSLSSRLPVWPGSPGLRWQWIKQIKRGDPVNNAQLTTDIHVGTHIDAPLHFVDGGKPVETIPLEILVGPAVVVDLPHTKEITAADLAHFDFDSGPERLLLKTDNSKLWAAGELTFQPDFAALTAEAARWVVAQGIRLIGIDYLSIQRFHDGPAVHQTLLQAGVVILEGLNLTGVAPGQYELLCLPLKLVGTEGAPARAILRSLPGNATP